VGGVLPQIRTLMVPAPNPSPSASRKKMLQVPAAH
jgi:hypothetical protein